MKVVLAAYVSLMFLSLGNPAEALPGWDLRKSWTGEGKAPHYLKDSWSGSCFESWATRNLDESYQLVWQLGFADEWRPVSGFETLYVLDRSCQPHYFNLMLHGSAPGTCWPKAYFSPATPDNLQLRHFIRKIYRDEAPRILQDLQSARLILSGRLYFRQDARYRYKLPAPVDISAWRGHHYDYILSPLGFGITYRRSGYFSELKEQIAADQRLLTKLAQPLRKR